MIKRHIFSWFINGSMWSFLGVILAVTFFYLPQYRNPFNLHIIVDYEVDLVEVKERVKDLQILYRDEDILNTDRLLKLIRITFKNDGKTILQQAYDQSKKFGLRIENAVLLDVDVENSNSDYLKENILEKLQEQSYPESEGPIFDSVSELSLPKLIFEKGKYVSLKLYVLQIQKTKSVRFVPMGKIANIDHISITYDNKESADSYIKMFIKSLSIFVMYFVIAYFVSALIVVLTMYVILRSERYSRKFRTSRFLRINRKLTVEQKNIVKIYRTIWKIAHTKLLKALLKERLVVDFRVFIKEEIERTITKHPYLIHGYFLRDIERFEVMKLPPEIFILKEGKIELNQANKDFIISFFRQMKQLPE